MHSGQRFHVRQALRNQSFERTDYTDDVFADGQYAETWSHRDGTEVVIKWAPREPWPTPDPPDGSMLAQTKRIIDADDDPTKEV